MKYEPDRPTGSVSVKIFLPRGGPSGDAVRTWYGRGAESGGTGVTLYDCFSLFQHILTGFEFSRFLYTPLTTAFSFPFLLPPYELPYKVVKYLLDFHISPKFCNFLENLSRLLGGLHGYSKVEKIQNRQKMCLNASKLSVKYICGRYRTSTKFLCILRVT